MRLIDSFGHDAVARWNRLWDQIHDTTAKSTKFVTNTISKMVEQSTASLNRMQQIFNREFGQMADIAKEKSNDFSGYVKDAMGEAADATFKGLGYIVQSTQKGLKAFDSNEKININIQQPRGLAGGGYVGMPGERGADNVPTILGRGEAVLNWAHQKVVEPALRAAYGFGLGDLFQRTGAAHGSMAAGGMAGGGFTGPGHSGEGFTPVWNLAQQKFGMTYFTGFDGHSMITSSGNVSDHWYHRALDMGNGILTAGENALNAFFKTKVPQIVKQLIWKAVDQFTGAYIGDHTDHVHLAMPDAYAFDQMRTAKILAAAEKGIDFQHLLVAGADASGAAGFWDSMPNLKVKGTDGPLREIVQSGLNMVNAAANKFGEKIAGTLGVGLTGPIQASRALPGGWKRVGATYEGLTGQLGASGQPVGGMAFAELLVAGANAGLWRSDLAATLGLPNRQGLGMPFGTKIQVKRPGTLEAFEISKNDIGSGQAGNAFYKVDLQDAIADRLAGRTTQDIDVKKAARGGYIWPRFAGGGILGGIQDGEPRPVIAHVGEWILNKMQQARLAAMTGLTPDGLKSALGFSGGPHAFQGGGEVASLHTFSQLLQNFFRTVIGNLPHGFEFARNRDHGALEIALHLFHEAERAINAGADDISAKTKQLDTKIRQFFAAIAGDGGLLDQMGQNFDDLQTVMATRLAHATVILRHGNVQGRRLDNLAIVQRELDQLNKQLDFLLGERGVIGDALRKAEHALDIARRQHDHDAAQQARAAVNNLTGRMRDINSQIAQMQLDVLSKMEEEIQARQDEITRRAQNRQFGFDIRNRLADVQQTFGRTAQAARLRGGVLQDQRASIQQQLAAQEGLLARAQRQGLGADVIDPLKQAVLDLQTQLKENAAAQYENTIALRQAHIDAITGRQGFLGGVTDSLSNILNTLGSITGTVNQQGLIDLATQALNQLMNTGQDLRNQLTKFVGENALPPEAAGILATLQGLHGQDFVSAIAGLDMNSIINSLGGPDSPLAQQFESLIQAIIDNEGAVQENTDELQKLAQQNNIQQFTSTAWQWFRQAIFTGMGGLLPQYGTGTPYYAAQGGGEMVNDGPVWLHRGEIVVPPNFSSMLRRMSSMHSVAAYQGAGGMWGPMSLDFATRRAATMTNEMAGSMQIAGGPDLSEIRRLVEMAGDTNVTVNEAEPGTDPVYLANRIAFERRVPKS